MCSRRNLVRPLLVSACLSSTFLFSIQSIAGPSNKERNFERIASFPVWKNTSIDTESVAEIVAVDTHLNPAVF